MNLAKEYQMSDGAFHLLHLAILNFCLICKVKKGLTKKPYWILLILKIIKIFKMSCYLIFMIGYFLFDKLTPFNTSQALADKNTAVGIVVGSMFIGLGVAIGLVIGMGLN